MAATTAYYLGGSCYIFSTYKVGMAFAHDEVQHGSHKGIFGCYWPGILHPTFCLPPLVGTLYRIHAYFSNSGICSDDEGGWVAERQHNWLRDEKFTVAHARIEGGLLQVQSTPEAMTGSRYLDFHVCVFQCQPLLYVALYSTGRAPLDLLNGSQPRSVWGPVRSPSSDPTSPSLGYKQLHDASKAGIVFCLRVILSCSLLFARLPSDSHDLGTTIWGGRSTPRPSGRTLPRYNLVRSRKCCSRTHDSKLAIFSERSNGCQPYNSPLKYRTSAPVLANLYEPCDVERCDEQDQTVCAPARAACAAERASCRHGELGTRHGRASTRHAVPGRLRWRVVYGKCPGVGRRQREGEGG